MIKIVENGKTYLVEYELIEYFDLNQLPIKVYKNEIKREEIKQKEKEKKYIPPISSETYIYNAKQDSKWQFKTY